jgi:two-component system, chemotaxis family, chemotaxis protein CheY
MADGMTILLADSHQTMRQAIKSGIRAITGGDVVEFIEAADGSMALGELMNRPSSIDIALIDWEMTPMNGSSFLRMLRNDHGYQAHRTMPVIVITGHPSSEVMSSALRAGASSLMPKPVVPAALVTRIKAVLSAKPEFVMVENALGGGQPFIGPLSKWSLEQFIRPAQVDKRKVVRL